MTLTQMSMYFYSLLVFAALCVLTPRLRARDALAALAFAFLYALDSAVNVAYTLVFARAWFAHLAERDAVAGVLQPESATSIMVVAASWAVRVYFVAVAFANARAAVRAAASQDAEPFADAPGWQGRLGRALVAVGRGYWKGDGYAALAASKFRRSEDGRFRRGDSLSIEV